MTVKDRPRTDKPFINRKVPEPKSSAAQFKPVAELEALLTKLKERAKLSFEDWIAVGSRVSAIQQRAMHDAHSNSPKGKRYNAVWKDLTINAPEVRDMKAFVRSDAVWVYEHADTLKEWFAKQPSQYNLNTPGSIRSAFRRDQDKSAPKIKQKPGTRTKNEDVEAVVLKVTKERDQYKRERDHYKADLDVVHDKLDKANKLIASLKTQLKRKS